MDHSYCLVNLSAGVCQKDVDQQNVEPTNGYVIISRVR
jgi:hypothetical protein